MKRARTLTVVVALIASLLNASPAKAASVQIASFIDWNGFSLGADAGFAQSITPLLLPNASTSFVEFSLNVGNSTSLLTPLISFNNRSGGEIRFTIADAGADIRTSMSGSTFCNIQNSNLFGDKSRYAAICTTSVPINIGETYTFEVRPLNWGILNTWTAYVNIKSTNQRINLGVITFANSSDIINRSASMSGFNQTSVYGENLTCQTSPKASATYGKPFALNSGTQPTFSATRGGTNVGTSIACSNFSYTQNLDGSFTLRTNVDNPDPIGSQISNSANHGSTSQVVKPATPTFSAVNFSGNKININVNLGASGQSQPDKIYLVAPKLGFSESNPAVGLISGTLATWSIPFSAVLGGTSIPLQVISEKNGVKSDPLTGSYLIPGAQGPTVAPKTPTNFSNRIVGTSAIVTVKVDTKSEAAASDIFLYSPQLGILKSKPLSGDVLVEKAIIEIPLKSSMSGKKYQIFVYASNSKGESKTLEGSLSVPAAPKQPKLPTSIAKPEVQKTVICTKGNQARTFIGSTCPPGWSKKG